MRDFTDPVWGLIPAFIRKDDTRPVAAQINERYAFGGWKPRDWWTVIDRPDGTKAIRYPEDPPRPEIGRQQIRTETVILFQGSYVGIFQPDGSHEIACID